MSDPDQSNQPREPREHSEPSTSALQTIPVEGHTLTIERAPEGGAVLRLTNAGGDTPLTIELTSAGPVLRVGTGLAIAVDGDLRFAAERVDIQARAGLELRSGGDVIVNAEGDNLSSAREHVLEARLGDVRLDANDDVKIAGERIRLNC